MSIVHRPNVTEITVTATTTTIATSVSVYITNFLNFTADPKSGPVRLHPDLKLSNPYNPSL